MADTTHTLDFEKPVNDLESELMRLQALFESGEKGLKSEIERTRKKLEKTRSEIFGNLSTYQRVKLSRHLDRPFSLDYIKYLVSDFVELHGDRCFGDDGAIVGGIGNFAGKAVMVVGHQRGRTIAERMERNFGMPQPEGNRKAQRLFKLAEKFNLPLVLLVDTQGAYPGLEAEERGQAEAIARSLYVLSSLRVPIISCVIGEGGSGGALALGVCDRLLMLENAIYSVITPEGCASILWGKEGTESLSEYAAVAADALKLTANHLLEAGIVDEIVSEPLGGAHRDRFKTAERLGEAMQRHMTELLKISVEELLANRYEKFRRIGSLF